MIYPETREAWRIHLKKNERDTRTIDQRYDPHGGRT